MAKDAYAYTSKFVRGSGNEVRPDDVVPTLTPALEVSDRLRTYLAERKLSAAVLVRLVRGARGRPSLA